MPANGKDPLREQIDIGNYFYPLLYHVAASLTEIDYIIALFDLQYDFKFLKDRLSLCKKSCEGWLGDYAFFPEPQMEQKIVSITKTCDEISEFFDIALTQEVTNFRAKVSYIRTLLFNLKKISSAQLKLSNWRVE